MSRKNLLPHQSGTKAKTLNKLLQQLEDPRSLMSFLTPDMQACLHQIPDDYIDLDEHTLLEKLKLYHNWVPTVSHEML